LLNTFNDLVLLLKSKKDEEPEKILILEVNSLKNIF